MDFVISFPFLSILVTSFCIGTEKIVFFSVFSYKQENYFSNSSANTFMIKDDDSLIHSEKL